MSIFKSLNRSLFKRTSSFVLTIAVTSFFFDRAFEATTQSIFEYLNRGKLWKDIKDNYGGAS